MRYVFAVLLVVSGIYFYAFRSRPASAVVTAPPVSATSPPAGRDFLKRPLERTQEVLEQVRTRRDSEAF